MNVLSSLALQLTVRYLFLLLFALVFAFIFGSERYLFSQVVIGGIWIILAYELYHYLNSTNRLLARFIDGVRLGDLTYSVPSKKTFGRSRKALQRAMTSLTEQIQASHKSRQAEQYLLSRLLNESREGWLVFDERGKVWLQNWVFTKLMKIPPVSDIASIRTISPDLFQFLVEQGRMNWPEGIFGKIKEFKIDDQNYYALGVSKNEDWLRTEGEYHNLIKVMNHEIMNGISPMISLSDSLIAKTELWEDQEEKKLFSGALNTIRKQADNLVTFSDRYRKLIRIPMPNIQISSWNKIMEEVLELHKESLGGSIRFQLSGAAVDAQVKLDKSQWVLVFTNLINNSLQASKGLDSLRMKCEIEQDKLDFLLRFSDDGPGIPEDHFAGVFVPFFTTYEEGSGIGLSLCRKIIENHGGTIRLDGDQKEGASFLIRLPRI